MKKITSCYDCNNFDKRKGKCMVLDNPSILCPIDQGPIQVRNWIPITNGPEENGTYILYRPESDSQHFAYYWQNENIDGIKGWVNENEPINIDEYTHYYKPLDSPMV